MRFHELLIDKHRRYRRDLLELGYVNIGKGSFTTDLAAFTDPLLPLRYFLIESNHQDTIRGPGLDKLSRNEHARVTFHFGDRRSCFAERLKDAL